MSRLVTVVGHAAQFEEPLTDFHPGCDQGEEGNSLALSTITKRGEEGVFPWDNNGKQNKNNVLLLGSTFLFFN